MSMRTRSKVSNEEFLKRFLCHNTTISSVFERKKAIHIPWRESKEKCAISIDGVHRRHVLI
jgi:hypothetical protein